MTPSIGVFVLVGCSLGGSGGMLGLLLLRRRAKSRRGLHELGEEGATIAGSALFVPAHLTYNDHAMAKDVTSSVWPPEVDRFSTSHRQRSTSTSAPVFIGSLVS